MNDYRKAEYILFYNYYQFISSVKHHSYKVILNKF